MRRCIMLKYLLSFILLATTAIAVERTYPIAGERTYTFNLGPNQSVPTNHPPTHYIQRWADTIELPYLSPSVGNLERIDITIEQYVEYEFHWELLHPLIYHGTRNRWDRINHIVKLVDPNTAIPHTWGVNSFVQAGDSCAAQTPFDGVLDFGGTSGFSSGTHYGMYTSHTTLTGSDCDYYNRDSDVPFILEVRGRLMFQFESYEPIWIMGVTDYTWTAIKVKYTWS